jgi:hypothetical protein
MAQLVLRKWLSPWPLLTVELFGSLKNMAQRLLDSLRYRHWPDEVFDSAAAASIQIRLDSS